jgi:hypothetical protein
VCNRPSGEHVEVLPLTSTFLQGGDFGITGGSRFNQPCVYVYYNLLSSSAKYVYMMLSVPHPRM